MRSNRSHPLRHETRTAHLMTRTQPPFSLPRWSGIALSACLALVVTLAAGVLALSSPRPAAALTAGQQSTTFPRLTHWWGSSSLAEDARRDYYVPNFSDPQNPDTAAIAKLRALNPNIILLASSSAAELDYSLNNDRAHDAQRLGAIPTAWLLTQVGSTLTLPVTSTSSTSISVADTSKFRVSDLIVIDDEKCLVTAIGSALTVSRGYAGSTAATHASGTRVAAVVSDWPGYATLDMTAGCPLGRATGAFATPGTGTERARDWLARRTAGISAAADWDGVLVDVCAGDYATCFRGSTSFRTIADRATPTSEADYTAFDTAWQNGIVTYLASVRSLVGAGDIILTNSAPPAFSTVNGTDFEGFPTASTTPSDWRESVIGPTRHPWTGAYLDWSANSMTPNLTTIMSYGSPTDYQLMRFGLCTTLMGNGYYAYEESPTHHDVTGRWYDEYDNAGTGKGYLGAPLADAAPAVPPLATPDLLGGSGTFSDTTALNAWALYPRTGYAATKSLDGGTAKLSVTQSGGEIGGVEVRRLGIGVAAGSEYTLTFRARADSPMTMQAQIQKVASPFTAYASSDELRLSTDWQTFEIPMTSSATDGAAELTLLLGGSVGNVWIDDVKLQAGDRTVYRRDFQNGIALVNPTNVAVTIDLGGTFQKIRGTQAPAVNDGSLVNAVTLQPRDGIVLLRTSKILQALPVYRFYNKNNGSHFYTASEAEKFSVLSKLSATYSFDGVAYTVNTADTANRSPLYRFYNKTNGSHFYTASEAEKASVLANQSATYSYDGPAYNVCLTPVSGATTVWRFFNKKNGSHFYTASAAEKASVIAKLSATYSLDGAAFYLAP